MSRQARGGCRALGRAVARIQRPRGAAAEAITAVVLRKRKWELRIRMRGRLPSRSGGRMVVVVVVVVGSPRDWKR